MPPRHFISDKATVAAATAEAPAIWTVYIYSVYPDDMPIDNDDVMAQWTDQIIFDNRIQGEDLIDRLNGLYLGGGRYLSASFHAKQTKRPASIAAAGSADLTLMRLVNMTIEKVVTCGQIFENALMKQEFFNPRFAFLFDSNHVMHDYYNRCVDQLSGRADGAYAPEIENLNALGQINYLHLQILLQHVTGRRGSIARVMAFAFEHVKCADEIGSTIYNSIVHAPAPKTNDEIRQRMARVYVIHDIIANQPPMMTYSKVFEPMVGKIREFFEGLQCTMMTKERINNQLNGLILS